MKAMILAAGRGERMRPLTDSTPKPLLLAGNKPIIQHTIEQLVSCGYTKIVINIAYLGHKIIDTLGSGNQFGASITYSDEGENALETAGGIFNALPKLGKEPFLVVNGDVFSDYDFSQLHNKPFNLAHLVLIPNPAHHPEGDFHLTSNGLTTVNGSPTLTYSGIGIFNPVLFSNTPAGKVKLAPLLRNAMAQNKVTGEEFNGFWLDIGTPERLIELDDYLNL
ncbi:MAG: nucleotidyltransferase family protein [Methylococcaceae bacterium]|nr:nucleotidyltransferase family protein [Methylococcaceae bacterium]